MPHRPTLSVQIRGNGVLLSFCATVECYDKLTHPFPWSVSGNVGGCPTECASKNPAILSPLILRSMAIFDSVNFSDRRRSGFFQAKYAYVARYVVTAITRMINKPTVIHAGALANNNP